MTTRIDAGAVLVGVGAVALGLVVWRAREAAASAVDLVNPASAGNVAYRAANAITRAVTGNPAATLGTAIHAAVNPTRPGALVDEFRRVGAVAVHRSAGFSGVRWRVYVGGRWIDGPAPTAAAWAAAKPIKAGEL